MKMDELAAPAHAAVAEGRVRIHPEGQRRRYLDWLENIRPWCISRQLWWGHQIPVWYRGDETYVGMDPPNGPGWERDPDVLDTWFSSALWPFATLGWPDQTDELKAFYPTDVLLDGARHPVPVGRPDGLHGARVRGRHPVRRRLRALGRAGAGRAPDVQVAGHGHRPADADRRRPAPAGVHARAATSPPTAPTRSATGCWRCPRRRTCASTRARSPRAASSPTSSSTRRGSCCCACPRASTVPGRARRSRRRSRTRGSCRACRRPRPTSREAIEGFEFHRATRSLYGFVYGELCDWYLEMLKPRLYAEDNARDGGVRAARAGRDAGAGAPDDPVRHRGDLVLPARPARPADGPSLAERRRSRCATPRPRRRSSARSTPPRRCARGATASARRRARAFRRGSRPTGYERVAEHVARLARFEFSANGDEPVATVGVPGGSVLVLASDAVDLEAEKRRAAERAGAVQKEIARAEGKLANQGFVAKAPEARRPGRARQAGEAQAGAGRALMSSVGPRPRPRSTCSRWSCSACASAWSACGGC